MKKPDSRESEAFMVGFERVFRENKLWDLASRRLVVSYKITFGEIANKASMSLGKLGNTNDENRKGMQSYSLDSGL